MAGRWGKLKMFTNLFDYYYIKHKIKNKNKTTLKQKLHNE